MLLSVIKHAEIQGDKYFQQKLSTCHQDLRFEVTNTNIYNRINTNIYKYLQQNLTTCVINSRRKLRQRQREREMEPGNLLELSLRSTHSDRTQVTKKK